MKNFRLLTLTLTIIMITTACVQATPAVPVEDQVSAAVAATLAAIPPVQPTPAPTYTAYPTYTPYPTLEMPELPQTLEPTSTNAPVIAPTTSGDGNDKVNSDYACALVSKKPADWTFFNYRDTFNATWKVRNTGNKVWQTSGIDFIYVSGTKMQTHNDLYDLPENVDVGRTVQLVVDMVAPKATGYYTTTWGLATGSKIFCTFSLSINVK